MGLFNLLREWKEKADGTLEGPAISTGSVLNSEIGDNVDYADPRWLSQSDAYHLSINWESIDGFDTITTGSATADTGNLFLSIDTGATSGSVGEASAFIEAKATPASLSFDSAWALATGLRIVDSDTDLNARVTFGRIGSGEPSFGFVVETVNSTPKLRGVVHDGTNESRTDLIDNPGAGRRQTRVEFTPGESVEFVVDGTTEGTITSDLPSGDITGFPRVIVVRVDNTSAVQRRFRVAQYNLVNLP